jgi:putative transposase
MTDAEWALIEPHMPAQKALGRPRIIALRGVVDALLYILRTACPWRLLPRDFPNRSTVQRYFYPWQGEGLWEKANFLLVQIPREREDREASPSAGVIDNQSVKTTESGCRGVMMRARRSRGRKRHIVTDTCGHLVGMQVHAADIQDRDGAHLKTLGLVRSLDDLERPLPVPDKSGLQFLASVGAIGSWVVEQTFAWFGRNRRLAKDFERTIASSQAWLYLASVQLLARRMARPLTTSTCLYTFIATITISSQTLKGGASKFLLLK